MQNNQADKSFKMTIMDTLIDTKPGTTVVGVIESGQVKVGDDLWIVCQNSEAKQVAVVGIMIFGMFTKRVDSADNGSTKGKDIGIILKDIALDEVSAGQILSGSPN